MMNRPSTQHEQPSTIENLFQELPHARPIKAQNKKQVGAYYRSKVYTSQTGVNSLVTAAQPILSFLDRIQYSAQLPVPKSIHHKLVHELQAFETYAHSFNYPEDFIIVGRLILSITLDDILQTLKWPDEEEWNNHKFIPILSSADDSVFVILERIKQSPQEYIDLLELIYLCLSIGFEGKYRDLPNGKHELDAIIESLYEVIRRCRGDIKEDLLLSAPPLSSPSSFTLNHAISIFIIFTSCILLSLYISFNYMLNLNTHTILNDLQQLLQQLKHINY